MRVSQKWIVKAFARSRSQVVVPRRPSIRDVIAIERGRERERERAKRDSSKRERGLQTIRDREGETEGGRDGGREGGREGAAGRPIGPSMALRRRRLSNPIRRRRRCPRPSWSSQLC